MKKPTLILTKRLYKLYNPFHMLGVKKSTDLKRYKSQHKWVDHDNDFRETNRYHYGRIRYFVECLKAGQTTDPVEVEAFDWLIIDDGHHRFIAHILANKRYTPISFSGYTRVLDYLKGKTKKCPEI